MLKQLLVLSAAIVFFASCKNDATLTSTNCAMATDSLQREIAARETRINGLLDSLKMMMGNTAATTTTADTTAVTTAAAATDNAGGGDHAGNGKSFYKTKRAHTVPAGMHTKYPGEFPEGSARALTEQDLKFLSPWGLKVMQNEIYARHGMRFTDGEMQDHFRRQGWYKGTEADVSSKLSPTERQNLTLIKSYKYTPQIGV